MYKVGQQIRIKPNLANKVQGYYDIATGRKLRSGANSRWSATMYFHRDMRSLADNTYTIRHVNTTDYVSTVLHISTDTDAWIVIQDWIVPPITFKEL